MTDTMPRVGLDVHANQTHAAMLDLRTGELKRRRIQGPPECALEYLAALEGDLIAVYEAGPTGFALARAAHERGIDSRVAAPGLIPRGPTDRVKTDARDAERLARLLIAGELSFVHVLSIEEERFRDLVRCREDIRGDLMRARHRLSKLLLRRGLRYLGSGGNWTEGHRKWLASLRFEDPASSATFTDYLVAVGALEQRRDVLEREIERSWPECPHAETIARLRAFRGIDTLTAAGICAEVNDFRRFAKPKLLSGYLGIVPSEWTSDESRGRSPRPAPSTGAGCWSRRRTTMCTGRASASSCACASAARTHVSSRSPGARSGACTRAGATSEPVAASLPARSPSPARASCRRFCGRPPRFS